MDGRPIGVFDSGVGGLTCIPHILRTLPHERIVYFGDTARAPYGTKTPAAIAKLSTGIADFLVERHDAKLIAVACNTISAVALDALRKRHPHIPVLGIIDCAGIAVKKACAAGSRIGVIATKATVLSGNYVTIINRHVLDASVFQQPCPIFVSLVEEGIVGGKLVDSAIDHYLGRFIEECRIDTLVLGCTHFPLLRGSIERLYPALRIVDPAEEMAGSIADALSGGEAQAAGGAPAHSLFASSLTEAYGSIADMVFAETGLSPTLEEFDIEGFEGG